MQQIRAQHNNNNYSSSQKGKQDELIHFNVRFSSFVRQLGSSLFVLFPAAAAPDCFCKSSFCLHPLSMADWASIRQCGPAPRFKSHCPALMMYGIIDKSRASPSSCCCWKEEEQTQKCTIAPSVPPLKADSQLACPLAGVEPVTTIVAQHS